MWGHTTRQQPILSMSQTQRGQSKVYADSDHDLEAEQGNWWGKQHDHGDEAETQSQTDASPITGYQYDRARWNAHKILKGTSRKLCGHSFSKFDLEIDLTNPEIYPPEQPAARQGNARRYNPEMGYITGPHDTWVKLDDRPYGEFVDLVELLLQLWRETLGISDRESDRLREFAKETKSHQDHCDEDILTKMILAATHPNGVFAYFD